MQDFEYRAQFQGAAQAEGFKPITAPDPTPLMEKNAQIEQDNMRAEAEARLEGMRQQEKFRAVYADKRLTQLAEFSKTLGDLTVEAAEAFNQSELLAGLNEDLNNPSATADQQAEYDAQVAQLKQEDENFQTAVDSLERSGAPKASTQQMRFASGWRGYGQRVRALTDLGAKVKPYIQNALQSDDQFQIPDPLNPGEFFTPSQAFQLSVERGEAYLEAAISVLTDEFFKANGVLNYNPGLVANTLLPQVRKTKQEISQTQRAEILKEKQNVGKQEAKETFIADVRANNYSGQSFQDLVFNLSRFGGLTRTEAVAEAFKFITEAEDSEILSEGDVDKIFEEHHKPTNKPVGVSFEMQIAEARADIRKQRYERGVLNDKIEKQELVEKAKEIMATMDADGNYKKSTVIQAAKEFMSFNKVDETHPAVRMLMNYANRNTIDGQEYQQALAEAEVAARTGFLTSGLAKELYPVLFREGIPSDLQALLEQNDQTGKPPTETESKKNQQLEKSLLREIQKNSLTAGFNTPSVNGMLRFAEDESLRLATQYMLTGKAQNSWEVAFEMSHSDLVQQLQKKEGVFNYVGTGDSFRFPAFEYDSEKLKALEAEGVSISQNIERKAVKDATAGGFSSLTDASKTGIFDEKDVEFLSANGFAPNTAAGSKLNNYVRRYNQAQTDPTKFITHDEALNTLLVSRGKRADTGGNRKKDEYEKAARQAKLDRLIYTPTTTGMNHVAIAGGLSPISIRQGDAGVTDVMQAAVHFKMAPNIVPLAGAVFALESARGTAPSGKNNFFGIKGSGTVRTTTEYAGQVTQAEFKDYDNPLQSVYDFGQLLNEPRYAAVKAAKTPKEAAIALRQAGYATDPDYVSKVMRLYDDMGIDPNVPFSNQRLLAESPYSDPSTMGVAARKFITGNTGASTGAHVHVGYIKEGKYVNPSPILDRLLIKGKPINDGRFRMSSGYGSRFHPIDKVYKPHRGIDYATEPDTQITVRGATYVDTQYDPKGGVISIYRLPGGSEILLMHGSKSNMR